MKYKRLILIGNIINDNEKVLDIGTDHAIIPVMLLKEKNGVSVTATDINDEPLLIAKKMINDSDLENEINLIKSDGLENINPNEFDVIIIAGMGGRTISKIIGQKIFLGKYILHPTTDLLLLRHKIRDIGMKISNEWVIKEGKVYNIIIEVISGNMILNSRCLYMGPYLIKKQESIPYYKSILKKLNKNSISSGNKNLMIQERKWLEEKIWNE